MSYTAPTVCELQTMFPAFVGVDDAVVQSWLDRAATTVDQSWTEADYAFAQMLLACHLMTDMGIGAVNGVEGAAANLKGVTSFKSGSFQAQFSEEAANASVRGGYGSTTYGRQFQQLQRRNKAGPRASVDQYPVGYVLGYPGFP